ncbi:PEP-CTERM sorting domain-containing protein [Aquabacterium sp. OR-4]|uniref:PEP-CTERM sorting domain-containing protein n=1 Tax=Aquabacterium sp. OR-4 TaxID=2978127 RepID=UPI0028C86CA7|nr:PEP-CTERM sorting domain-containing protein [Aquabacterium sp. OR-4]MDT7838675.1 PEP-CTERM sorting domain-containing protein [Aquabacterium sp. OR-4]
MHTPYAATSSRRHRASAGPAWRRRPVGQAVALALQAGLLCLAGGAQAQTFNDLLVFETSNQSLWSSGAASGWRYDSGLIGGTWGGGRSASSPVSLGISGITGSANALITPEVPGYTIPGVPPQLISPAIPSKELTPYVAPQLISPAVPATYITVPAVKVLGVVVTPAYQKQVTPAIPAVYSAAIPATYSVAVPAVYSAAIPAVVVPAVPAVYGDTRTGAAVAVTSSGELGFKVQAAATAGAVAVKLPVQATLNLPTQFVSGQSVHVAGTATIDSSASIKVSAASLKASVTGVIQTSNDLGATGCFAGAGCSSSSSSADIDQSFEIVTLNTASSRTVSALGLPLPIVSGVDLPINVGAQTVGHVVVTLPQDQSGGTVSGSTLALDTHQSVIKATADFGGIAQAALGVPADVLQPSVSAGPGSIGGVVVNLQGGVDLGMSQSLSLDADFMVTLTFDQAVTMTYRGQTFAASKTVSFDLDEGADLVFTGTVGRLLERTYSLSDDTQLTNSTSLSIDPLFEIKAACYSLNVTGVANVEQCMLEKGYGTTDLLAFTVYEKSFELQGFNAVSLTSAVPEPESWALLLAGLAGVGLLAGRRQRR